MVDALGGPVTGFQSPQHRSCEGKRLVLRALLRDEDFGCRLHVIAKEEIRHVTKLRQSLNARLY